jgi:hypothetical protein
MQQARARSADGRGDSALALLALSHWRVLPPFVPDAETLNERSAPAAELAGLQAKIVAARRPDLEFDHVVCTACLSPAFTSAPSRTGEMAERVAAQTGRYVAAIIHAYECAGWGYAVRFLSDHSDAEHVLISIIDLDLCNLTWVRYPPYIGESGFGVTSLLLKLPRRWADVGVADGPYPDSGIREFVRTLRAWRTPGGPPMFGPYLRADLRDLADRILGDGALSPNRMDAYGHSFGSDGWISLIEWLEANPLSQAQGVTVATLAYGGYFSICSVEVTPETWVELRTFDSVETSRGAEFERLYASKTAADHPDGRVECPS